MVLSSKKTVIVKFLKQFTVKEVVQLVSAFIALGSKGLKLIMAVSKMVNCF